MMPSKSSLRELDFKELEVGRIYTLLGNVDVDKAMYIGKYREDRHNFLVRIKSDGNLKMYQGIESKMDVAGDKVLSHSFVPWNQTVRGAAYRQARDVLMEKVGLQ
ncbi:hypothetical protein KW805_03310 [Candidatus Pacearchaeota archaeon]|nr:hypothetical protein [Candidatus Pacearchaeota archaeon]